MATAVEPPAVTRSDDAMTPTASHFTVPHPHAPRDLQPLPEQETPTRLSHTPSLSEKRPLPKEEESGTPANASAPPVALNSSPTPRRPPRRPSQADLKMGDEEEDEEEQDGSDNENQDEDGRPAKKKRSQRFFCTEFPPCNLSFTRSEHLARHIRKHTGERPFQCHCLRRFSRLDNLRQHAQTVHVNEDIPVDSPAATGTRFQKQVRTDRIRPAGHRQRASTLSAPGGHSRGHSRNLSTSSIGSISDFGSPDDPRRRPPTLSMAPATPPRPMMSVDAFGAPPAPVPYYNYPPSGYSTPSAYSAADPASPRLASGLASPIALVPRTNIGWGGHNSSRRLSIPSGPNPYQPPHFALPPSAPFVSHSGYAHQYAAGPPVYPHPQFGHSRHESLESADADWRRRTWHVSTRSNVESRPATSGLSYTQRPDDPQPVSAAQPAAQQAVRLPGIDSFDRPQMQAGARSRRMTNDMEVDDTSTIGDDASSKRDSWSSMHQNLNQLELAQNTPPRDAGYWRPGATAPQPAAARPVTAPHSGFATGSQDSGKGREGPAHERPSTPKRQKRTDWSYEAALAGADAGPGPAVRTSPEGSSNSDELPTPGASAAEYRPAIVHSNGYVESQQGGILVDPSKPADVHGTEVQDYAPIRSAFPHESPKSGEDTGRLDALVAVATSEERNLARH